MVSGKQGQRQVETQKKPDGCNQGSTRAPRRCLHCSEPVPTGLPRPVARVGCEKCLPRIEDSLAYSGNNKHGGTRVALDKEPVSTFRQGRLSCIEQPRRHPSNRKGRCKLCIDGLASPLLRCEWAAPPRIVPCSEHRCRRGWQVDADGRADMYD